MEGKIVNKVYLIGAGPGDPKLITVKGLELLKKCDVVIYDYLATDALLCYVKPECEKIYVGKQAGKHYKTQEEINQILVDCGKKYSCVVRLKGGDPFVFGRGGEEVEALQANNIAFEVVPGVTSAVAVAECAGIPVTHRGVARSFHVITGHTKTSGDCPDYDYQGIARMEGTLVFLMGLSSLEGIAQALIREGKDGKTPAAVISSGTMPNQQVVRGKLENIAKKTKEEKLSSPAVIVVGEVADYLYMDKEEQVPLVGIVATDAVRKKIENGLEQMHWRSVPICNMVVCPSKELQLLKEELKQIEMYTWVVFTSQNGVKLFFEQVKNAQLDYRKFADIKFAALGSGTAECLKTYGIYPDFVPSAYTVEQLCKELIPQLSKEDRLLIPRALRGSKILTQELSEHHICYKELKIYDVKGCLSEQINQMNQLQYLVFVSASGVDTFFDELAAGENQLPEHIKIACIGHITEACVKKRYKSPEIVATECDVRGLLSELKKKEERFDEN